MEDRTTEEAHSTLLQPAWPNNDLAEVARLVREVSGEAPLVDLGETFGDPPTPDLSLPDGLHPSLAGQSAVAATLVERLGGHPTV